MKLSIVTPVGPGHVRVAHRAEWHTRWLKEHDMGPFDEIEALFIDDTRGQWGRAAARNHGILLGDDADWYFFVDADDMIRNDACTTFTKTIEKNPDVQAIWGRGEVVFGGDTIICTGEIEDMTWEDVMTYHNIGTFGVGMFVRGDAARNLRFDEAVPHCEGFEFCVSLISTVPWIKQEKNLAVVDRDFASSGDHYMGCSAPWTRAFSGHTLKWKYRGRGALSAAELEKRHAAENERLRWCWSTPSLLEM